MDHKKAKTTLGKLNVLFNSLEEADEEISSIEKEYFEKLEGVKIPAFKVNIRVQNLLQKFILEDGFEI